MPVFQHVGAFGECVFRQLAGRVLPFGFARQAHAGPAGIRIGLEIADVRDRRLRLQVLHAVQGEGAPLVLLFFPVKRRPPRLGANQIPTQ
ncbi:hypothetical protein D3C72_1757540 [compost metagenome]